MRQHTFASSPSLTIAQIAQKLHELLTFEGWQIQWANTAAIGTGSASNPKWDGTAAATGSSAGLATYMMPLAGLTNRWIVQVEFRWAATAVAYGLARTTVGTEVNTSDGTLANPGRVNGGMFGNLSNSECVVTASQYGFAVIGNWASGNQWHGIERRRNTANTYLDDLLSHQFSTQDVVGFSSGGQNQCRNWAAGEYATLPLGFIHGSTGNATANGADIATLSSSDGNVGYPVGPFTTSNGLGGVLRHVLSMRPADAVAGVDQSIEIDGANRIYYPMTAGVGPLNTRTLVAKS